MLFQNFLYNLLNLYYLLTFILKIKQNNDIETAKDYISHFFKWQSWLKDIWLCAGHLAGSMHTLYIMVMTNNKVGAKSFFALLNAVTLAKTIVQCLYCYCCWGNVTWSAVDAGAAVSSDQRWVMRQENPYHAQSQFKWPLHLVWW